MNNTLILYYQLLVVEKCLEKYQQIIYTEKLSDIDVKKKKKLTIIYVKLSALLQKRFSIASTGTSFICILF